MANTQTSTSNNRQSSARAKQSGSAKRSSMANSSAANVESDETYGLVSVLYHALQGADTIDRYIEDAKAAENQQLVSFFEDCKAKQNEIALAGKRLLAEQLIDLAEEEEEAAEEGDEE